MIQSVRDKRSYDNRLFDVDCSDLLALEEVITACGTPTSVIPATIMVDIGEGVMADANASGFTFGTPVINAGPLLYPLYNHRAEAGKVVQVMIGGGVVPNVVSELLCTIRFPLTTNLGNAIEATVALRLIDSAP